MQMNEAQRQELAKRIATIRLGRYRGNRKAAYTEAGVNSATWARLENAQTVKENSLVAVLLALWPESGGDWLQLDPPLAGTDASDLEQAVESSNLSPAARDRILELIRNERDQGSAREVKGA